MIAAVLAAAVALSPGADESFESISALPPQWKLVEFKSGVSSASIQAGDAADGKHFLRLSAPQPNHTRVFIPTKLDPGAIYRFSARVRAKAPQPVNAVLNVDGSPAISDQVPGDGQWHARRLYVRTGSANKATLVLSLGWFGGLAAGNADFDLLKLKKVDAVPPGAPVAALGGASAAPAKAATPTATVDEGPPKAMLPLAALLLIVLAACGRILVRGDRVDD